MDTPLFYAGAAEVDITPPLGTLINGDFITHYARHIHDNLYSRALVCRNGATLLAIVIVDICVMQKDFIAGVKDQIKSLTGIPPENVLIASTHTHAAGAIESLLCGAADLPYRQKLLNLIVRSVVKAWSDLQPAKMASGRVDIPEHVVCRRYLMKPGYKAYNPVTGGLDKVKTNPSGHEDQIEKPVAVPDTMLHYLAIQTLNGQWISLLANYSMHYVGDWENGTITADYFGIFSRELRSRLNAGGSFIGMLSNGTSGDANIMDFLHPDRYPREHFKKSLLIGSDLADKVCSSLANVQWETDPSLSVLYKEITLSLRKPGAEEYEQAKKIVAGTDYETLPLKESHTGNEDSFRKIYAREQVLLYEYPEKILFPLQAIRIGSVLIGGLGAEIFSATGIWLKKQMAGENYFTICLANGCMGYVPPAHEFALGGYETWRCRSSCLEEQAEGIIKNELLDLIRSLKQ